MDKKPAISLKNVLKKYGLEVFAQGDEKQILYNQSYVGLVRDLSVIELKNIAGINMSNLRGDLLDAGFIFQGQ